MKLNLENLKVGDEITTIRETKDGFSYGPIRVITKFDEKLKMWRYACPGSLYLGNGAFPLTGNGYDFMSKRKQPDFFYTANPEHIKEAKRQHKEAKSKQKRKEQETARRMKLALPIGKLLKTEYYDSEECYHLDTTNDIVEILINRLSDEQISTLKEWLGV